VVVADNYLVCVPLPCARCRHETPMQPITMMRNAILSEGGSGVAIDRAAYAQSVAYWSEHAPIA
jgi:hypothetical protein